MHRLGCPRHRPDVRSIPATVREGCSESAIMSSVTIQGLGAVGAAAASRLSELGATVVAVSTARGSVFDEDGLDLTRLLALRATHGDDCVRQYPGKVHEPEAALQVHADVLIPAAREDVIDETLAAVSTAKLVVEGANLPTSAAARRVFHERAITVVPDF